MKAEKWVLFFISFPKIQNVLYGFLAITKLRATWKFSGFIPECNGLLFPVTVLKIGIIFL